MRSVSDSYGTFVGQVLAGLYPNRLRSIILDSAHYVKNSRVTALARFPHSAKGEDRVLP
jgi:pimeloyl-ACP methyl ester carboxylesterase